MTIRRLTHDDLIALNELWSVCYLYEAHMEEVKKKLAEDPHTPYGYGAFLDDGTMISAVLGSPYDMYFEGQTAPLCGIGGVVTHPCHRRMGAVRAIIAQILAEQYHSGTVFSGLYPFSYAFYRKFGYELGAALHEVRLPVNALRPYAGKYDVRSFRAEDDVSCLLPVFEAFAARYPLAIARKPEALRERLKPNPHAGNAYLYAVYEGGAPVAYVRFHKERENDENIVAVDDLAFVKPAHFRSLIGFMSVLEAEFASVKMALPADISLSALVDDPYGVHTQVSNRYMMRVVNCEKALGLLRLCPGESFTVRVNDEFLPVNSGTWRVSAEGVAKTADEPDIAMSIQAFSQMFCGFVSYETALYRPDVSQIKENPSLRRVFTAKPSFIGTYY